MPRYKIEDFQEGDTVEVSMSFGKNRKGIIQEVSENIKNGYPGINYEDDENGFCWAYLDQVVSVTKN